MSLKTISLFLGLCLLVACKQANDPNRLVSVDEIINDEIPSSFLEFHNLFHNNVDFQLSRIIFPLPGNENNTKWEKEGWVQHKPFNNIGNEYRRSYSNFQDIITERIIHTSGLFEMNRRFAKIDGDWHLIFYEVKQPEVGIDVDTMARDSSL